MHWNHVELYNVQSLVPDERGFYLSRVPDHVREQLNDKAKQTALNGCGTEIRFRLIGDQAAIKLRRHQTHPALASGIVEIYHGSFQASWEYTPRCLGQEETEVVVVKPKNLEQLRKLSARLGDPFDPEIVRIILPYDSPTVLIGITGEVAPPAKEQYPRKRYLAYGSSITHGGASVSPTETYAMQVARELKADLINLGFAGSAQLEPAMADYIACRQDWDIATLELGINVIYQWSEEEFAERVDYFVSRISDAHPNRPVFCIDMFRSAMDLEGNPKAEAFRRIVRRKVEELNRSQVKYISGLELLPTVSGLGADLVHPAPSGITVIARRLADITKKIC